jgi:hypothetical protein
MSSFSTRGGAQPAAVRTSVTWSGSAKANIPGAFGTGFGRGGKCCAPAVIGTSIHGFSASARQHTSAMRAFGAALRRILVKAASLSPKNITPKAEVNKSYSSSAAVAGSTCRQSILVMPAVLARLLPSASIGPEMSNPTTRPEKFTARANSSVGAPQPQPISTTRFVQDQTHRSYDAIILSLSCKSRPDRIFGRDRAALYQRMGEAVRGNETPQGEYDAATGAAGFELLGHSVDNYAWTGAISCD